MCIVSRVTFNVVYNIDSASSDWSREGWMKVIPRGSRSASAVNVQCVMFNVQCLTCRGWVGPPWAISRTCHSDKAQRRGISSTYFDSLSTTSVPQGRGQPALGLVCKSTVLIFSHPLTLDLLSCILLVVALLRTFVAQKYQNARHAEIPVNLFFVQESQATSFSQRGC